MSKYVLTHGSLVEVNDDELMHWKYIKREKKNGKWVYTYDLGKTEEKQWHDAVENYRNAHNRYQRLQRTPKHMTARAGFGKVDPYTGKYTFTEKEQKQIDERGRKLNVARISLDRAEKAAQLAVKKYRATPIYKIKVAKETVSDFFSNLFKKNK